MAFVVLLEHTTQRNADGMEAIVIRTNLSIAYFLILFQMKSETLDGKAIDLYNIIS